MQSIQVLCAVWSTSVLILGSCGYGDGIDDHGPDFSDKGVTDPVNWGIMADAQRLAYADRDQFIADPAFVNIPLSGMLNSTYLAERARLITSGKALNAVSAGDPWAYESRVSQRYGRFDQ